MALMFVPETHRATAIAPVTIMRRFRLRVRCVDCRAESTTEIEMLDEVDDRATVEDFYASGGANQAASCCPRCGGSNVTILGTEYVRRPTDV